MALRIMPFEERHVEAAAVLLAARHARDRAREAVLPAAFESPGDVQPHIERLAQRAGTAGVVAERDGEPVGFLLATAILPVPTQFLAQFYPPRSMSMPYEGHALAADEEPSLYRELYAALAGDWVRRGFFDHFVDVPDGDAAAREAWDSLGFARDITCVVREVNLPVAQAGRQEDASALEIHQVDAEEIDTIAALADMLWEHHLLSPIFAPYLSEVAAGTREMSLELLAEPANAHFVAYRDGKPLGMDTFVASGFSPPLATPEACIYLWQGIVSPNARGAGVGRALLSHAMGWAQEQGYRWCTLHFYAANLAGASFWLANGFRPLEHRLRRRVDERIAWDRA
jgi:GNAT superfamily N-acetyltransferase